MKIWVAQDNAGNLFITDSIDSVPTSAIEIHQIELRKELPTKRSENPTAHLEFVGDTIEDFSEILTVVWDG